MGKTSKLSPRLTPLSVTLRRERSMTSLARQAPSLDVATAQVDCLRNKPKLSLEISSVACQEVAPCLAAGLVASSCPLGMDLAAKWEVLAALEEAWMVLTSTAFSKVWVVGTRPSGQLQGDNPAMQFQWEEREGQKLRRCSCQISGQH